jgi:hypothetical protein
MTITSTSNNDRRHSVSIATHFWIPTCTTTTSSINTTSTIPPETSPQTFLFDASSKTTVVLSPAPENVMYSGRHDHGLLVMPQQQDNNDDDIAMLLSHCDDAKAHADEYLTRIMEQEQQSPDELPTTVKKARMG